MYLFGLAKFKSHEGKDCLEGRVKEGFVGGCNRSCIEILENLEMRRESPSETRVEEGARSGRGSGGEQTLALKNRVDEKPREIIGFMMLYFSHFCDVSLVLVNKVQLVSRTRKTRTSNAKKKKCKFPRISSP